MMTFQWNYYFWIQWNYVNETIGSFTHEQNNSVRKENILMIVNQIKTLIIYAAKIMGFTFASFILLSVLLL